LQQPEISVAKAFEILLLPEGATLEEAEAAYRFLTTKFHPDQFQKHAGMRSQAEEQQRRLNEAIRIIRLHLSASKATEEDRPRRPNPPPPPPRQNPPPPPRQDHQPTYSAKPAFKPKVKLWKKGLVGLGVVFVIGRIAMFVVPQSKTLETQQSTSERSNPITSLQRLLPPEAQVIERRDLGTISGKTRSLVLWMLHPERVVRQGPIVCADSILGDHWYGPTRLSLIDLAKTRIINTIEIREPSIEIPRPDEKASESEDKFPIPFYVSNQPYYVPRIDTNKEGTPIILNLRDLTGEGVIGQFVLFDYVVCGIPSQGIFGYSRSVDAAVQYRVEVISEAGNTSVQGSAFAAKEPIRPGYWNFTFDPGHGCFCTIHVQVSFDPTRQLFVENIKTVLYPKELRPF